MEACPGLKVQLVPVPRSFSLSEREADIAIMVGRPKKGRLRVRKLTDYTLGLYASALYLEARGWLEAVENLHEHDLAGYVEDLVYTSELIYSGDILSDWRSTVEVAMAIGRVEAVRSGAGIGVLHDFMAAGLPDLLRLIPDVGITRTYWTVWHDNLRSTRRVQAVVEFLDRTARAVRALFVTDGCAG